MHSSTPDTHNGRAGRPPTGDARNVRLDHGWPPHDPQSTQFVQVGHRARPMDPADRSNVKNSGDGPHGRRFGRIFTQKMGKFSLRRCPSIGRCFWPHSAADPLCAAPSPPRRSEGQLHREESGRKCSQPTRQALPCATSKKCLHSAAGATTPRRCDGTMNLWRFEMVHECSRPLRARSATVTPSTDPWITCQIPPQWTRQAPPWVGSPWPPTDPVRSS